MKEKIVCVEWKDAGYNSGYYDKEDKGRFEPVKTKTAGFVIRSDRKSLVLSHERFYDEEWKLDDERHITIFPRGMITRIAELKEK